MKTIGIIDCYIYDPTVHCFNHLQKNLPWECYYHLPGQGNINSLESREHDAYLVLGSASHVHENIPWHEPLAKFIENKLNQGIPVFAFCFGHQLMAHYWGGEVDYYRDPEYKILQTRNLEFNNKEIELAVSHRQVVKKIPDCLENISQSSMPNDLLKHKTFPYLSCQPHPEASKFFCKVECDLYEAEKIKAVQKNGLKLIVGFLKRYI